MLLFLKSCLVYAMSTQETEPTVLQLVVDDVLLSYINLHNQADFSQCIHAALKMGVTLGQMQEAARIDDAPRVLELLPWFVSSLDCLTGDLLAEWLEVVDAVKWAAMGASIDLLPTWVASRQKWVQKHGWHPIGSARPYDKLYLSKPAQKKVHLELVVKNPNSHPLP